MRTDVVIASIVLLLLSGIPAAAQSEAILAEVGHTHLAAVYWPGDKGPWRTTYDKKPLNGQVTRWQVWIGEDGARRRILG